MPKRDHPQYCRWTCLYGLGAILLLCLAQMADPAPAIAVESSAQTPLEQAASARAKGDLDSAVIILKNGLQRNPQDLPARLLLGDIYIEQGAALAAQKELEVARSLGANDRRINILLAKTFLLQAKFEDALKEVGGATVRDNDTVDMMIIRGQALAGLNRVPDAMTSFRRALDKAPHSADARIGLARAETAAGKWKEASAQLDTVLAEEPGNTNAWVARGELAQAQGNHQGALNAYSAAIDIAPDQLQVHMLRAAAYLDLNHLDEAMRDVSTVLEKVEAEPQALYLKAQILGRQGKRDEAAAAMQKAGDLLSNVDPDVYASYPTLLRLAGVVYASLDRNESAIGYFDRYLVYFPRDKISLRWRATLGLRIGKPADAIALIQRLLKDDPDDVSALNLMGIAQIRLQRFDTALPYFQRAMTLDPENSALAQGLGSTYLSTGDVRGAIATLSTAVAREPNNLGSVIMLVLAHIRNNDTKAARAVLAEAEKSSPQSPVGLQLAAAVDVADADFDAARDHLKAAVKLRPDYQPARLALAQIELQTQNYEASDAEYQAVLADDPDNLIALEGRGAVALGKSDLTQAANWYQQALKLAPDNASAVSLLMSIRLRQDMPRDAEKLATDFLRRHASNLLVLGTYTDYLNRSGRAAESIALYRDAITTSLPQPALHIGLAQAQLVAGGRDDAFNTLEAATRTFPVSAPLFRAYVNLALRSGDTARAMRVAETFAANQPENPTAAQLKGEVLMASGRYKEAYALYAGVNPGDANGATYVGRLKAAMAQGGGREEVPLLADWVRRHPGDTDAKSILAGAYQAFGDLKAAIHEYEGLRPRLPNHPVLLNNLAWLYYVAGDDRAVSTAARAYALLPDDANIADTYGWILAESGKPEEALPLLRKARAKNASEAIIQYHTGATLYKLGRMEDARRELESALSSGGNFDGIDRAREILDAIKDTQAQR